MTRIITVCCFVLRSRPSPAVSQRMHVCTVPTALTFLSSNTMPRVKINILVCAMIQRMCANSHFVSSSEAAWSVRRAAGRRSEGLNCVAGYCCTGNCDLNVECSRGSDIQTDRRAITSPKPSNPLGCILYFCLFDDATPTHAPWSVNIITPNLMQFWRRRTSCGGSNTIVASDRNTHRKTCCPGLLVKAPWVVENNRRTT